MLHFAASAYVGEFVVDPQKYYENNVVGTLSLLRAMIDAGCKRVVFSSSCAVYGEPAVNPITEDTPHKPVNPYGASKAMVERILDDFARAYGMGVVALRYFNACGADPEGEIGELRDPETHLIARAMMAIQGHITDFAVFGTDYATADGTAIRDYVHVSDLADAHVTSVRRLLGGGVGGNFNLGTGRGYSVKRVLDAIAAVTGEQLTGRGRGHAVRAIHLCSWRMPRWRSGNSASRLSFPIWKPWWRPPGRGIAGRIRGGRKRRTRASRRSRLIRRGAASPPRPARQSRDRSSRCRGRAAREDASRVFRR